MLIGLIGGTLVVYGNACSVRRSNLSSLDSGSSDLNGSNSANSALTLQKINNEDYDACLVSNNSDFDKLPDCLSGKGVIPTGSSAAMKAAITACNAEKNNKIFMAVCLDSKGYVVDHHRTFIQSDIDKCKAKVEDAKIASCLSKHGLLPQNISQADISACIAAVGVGKVEKCLRKKSFLPTNSISQFDVNLCSKAGSANLYDCLLNSDLVPGTAASTADNFVPQFLQADVDACVQTTGVGVAGVLKCLRGGGKLSRVVMAHQINRCISQVGVSKLAACLELNGLTLSNNGVNLVQSNIDSCIADKGEENLISCLRWDLGFLNRVLVQADINECIRINGTTGISRCLSQNSLLPNNVTQVVIETCLAAVAANPNTTLLKCLRKNSYIHKALLQGDINSCAKLVDSSKIATCLNANVNSFAPLVQADIDDCITKVGVGSLAKCLKNKALIPVVLTQEHINGCAAFAGMNNIAACLNANGFVDANAVVPITQTLIDTCVTNVGLGNVRKCLANNNAVPKVIDENATLACTLFAGSTPEALASCYSKNGLQ